MEKSKQNQKKKSNEHVAPEYVGYKIDQALAKLEPRKIAELKLVQHRFATFQTFLHMMPCYNLCKLTSGRMTLTINFKHKDNKYSYRGEGMDVLGLIPSFMQFIQNLPEEVKKEVLKI